MNLSTAMSTCPVLEVHSGTAEVPPGTIWAAWINSVEKMICRKCSTVNDTIPMQNISIRLQVLRCSSASLDPYFKLGACSLLVLSTLCSRATKGDLIASLQKIDLFFLVMPRHLWPSTSDRCQCALLFPERLTISSKLHTT